LHKYLCRYEGKQIQVSYDMSPSDDRNSTSDIDVADDESVSSTSTYDSTDENIWYSNIVLRMAPEVQRALCQPALDSSMTLLRVPGCKRALGQPAAETGSRHCEGANKRQKLYSDGLYGIHEAYQARLEATAELLHATKTLYSPRTMAVDPNALSIAPLLEQAIARQEPEPQYECSESDRSESSEEELPQPGVAHAVNDLESNEMMHIIRGHSEVKPTISFREALEPSLKPR
jgi:hypothetical protein